MNGVVQFFSSIITLLFYALLQLISSLLGDTLLPYTHPAHHQNFHLGITPILHKLFQKIKEEKILLKIFSYTRITLLKTNENIKENNINIHHEHIKN